MLLPSPFFQRSVLGDQQMPKHHGQARAAYALASAGISWEFTATKPSAAH